MNAPERAELLRRLQGFEMQPSRLGDSAVLEVVEQLASDVVGREELIRGFSASRSRLIVGALSFVLARSSAEPLEEDWPQLLSFLEQVRECDDAHTLQNCMTALQRRLAADHAWDLRDEAPEAVRVILKACLSHAGPEEQLVHHAAVQVLVELEGGGVLRSAFAPSDIEWLRRKLASMSATESGLLRDELRELRAFVAGG